MFKPQYKQLINMNGIEPKPSDVRKSRSIVTTSSFAFSAIASRFPQFLKCNTNMVASYQELIMWRGEYLTLYSPVIDDCTEVKWLPFSVT